MEPLAKMLMLAGGVLLITGFIVWLIARAGYKGLPGDMSYQGQHGSFYFPVVTCIVLSVLATVAMWIWQWLIRK